MRNACTILFLMVFACSASPAQVSLNKQVNQVFTLEQQGKYADAADVARKLVNSNSLSGITLGRTWHLLGLAYMQQDRLREAQNAFEQSIHLFENEPEYKEDYAAVLHSMADLYQSLGQLQVASRLELRSLNIFKQTGAHGVIARVSSNIAGLAISQNQIGEGKKYLEQAVKESKLATDLDDDDRASIFAIQGWLAVLHHDTELAISYYRQSLELWKHTHGENHALVGWGHVLVGRTLADTTEKAKALDEIRSGLSILDHTVGHQDPKFFAAKLAYSYALDANGLHREATSAKSEAQNGLKDFYRGKCASCTISMIALQ